jgi:hypothetical protein
MPKPPMSVRSYADRISIHWQKLTESIMDVARLCAEANDALTADEKKELIQLLPFEQPTFSKLSQIGKDKRLHAPKVQKLLPPNFSFMYEVTQLDDEDLKVAIKQEVITPTAKRSDVEEFRRTRDPDVGEEAPDAEPPRPELPDGFYAAIRLTDLTGEMTVERVGRIESLLDQIRTEFNAEIIRPRDRNAEAMARAYRQGLAEMQKGARRIVRRVKKGKLSKFKKQSKSQKKRLWAFTDDETDIGPDSTEEQIRGVLEMIGVGDEFEKLRDDAYAAINFN